jgi:hypothetical protein
MTDAVFVRWGVESVHFGVMVRHALSHALSMIFYLSSFAEFAP